MSREAVISGIGFVHPVGIGSSLGDLDMEHRATATQHRLGAGKTLHHYDVQRIEEHPYYPEKKMRRSMRLDSLLAYIAASIALEDFGCAEYDHRDTALFCSAGQCYGDMWPYIRDGLSASRTEDGFDIARFGETGHKRIYPFFSVRTLSALPMALVAEKFGIRGENIIQSSYGAESAACIQKAVEEIGAGRTKLAMVGGLDSAMNTHEIENLYFNNFYNGDFHGASSSCFIMLEEAGQNRRRGGKNMGTITNVFQKTYPVGSDLQIGWPERPFGRLVTEAMRAHMNRVVVAPTGTKENWSVELAGAEKAFRDSRRSGYFETSGTLLAAGEPFGSALLAMSLEEKETGISLARSVYGRESGVVVSKGGRHE